METTATGISLGQQAQAPLPQTNALSSDFETFLRMLTVQMKNQDPLNPIEASDFAVQLATFSGVEQQVKTNDLLTKLADGFGSSGLSELAGWIGKEIRTTGDASFEGAPLTLYPGQGFGNGDVGFLIVRDSSGLPVARYPFQGGSESVVWAGTGPDDAPLPNGLYRFEVEVMNGEVVARTVPVEHYTRVNEVRTGLSGPVLVTEGGATVEASAVSGVREAGY